MMGFKEFPKLLYDARTYINKVLFYIRPSELKEMISF